MRPWPALGFDEAEERLKAQSGGVGRDAPAGLPQRPPKAR